MRISQRGIDLIKKWEGFRAKPYVCQAGYLTIGYGHVIRKEQTFSEVTPEVAEQLLRIDISSAEKSVRRLIDSRVFTESNETIAQDRFDALVSFTYNLGGGALQRSTLRRKINSGEPFHAFEEFGKYRLAGGKVSKGLVLRRWDEAAMYTGAYCE
jgi:lysozyme